MSLKINNFSKTQSFKNIVSRILLKEAITDINNIDGEALTNLIHRVFNDVKKYSDQEENEVDITNLILNYVDKIKPESKKYFDNFKTTGRKIFLIKTDKDFVGTTENENGVEDIVVSYKLFNSKTTFKHELVHLIQYIEWLSKYRKGVKVKGPKYTKDASDNPNIYATQPDEFEKSVSMYISKLKSKNIKEVSNYYNVLRGVFKEFLDDWNNEDDDALYVLTKKPNLKKKILKRLVREGIQFKE